MQRRRRSKPHTFEERIAAEKAKIEAQLVEIDGQLDSLSLSPAKEALLKKIRQLDTASDMNEWLSSPESQPPTR
jgi:hypothetical protein